jgi:hypothetical protein
MTAWKVDKAVGDVRHDSADLMGIRVRGNGCWPESPAGGIIILWCSMETKRAASIYPTVDEINALPEKFREYIHDLETRCDKSGDVQTIAILRKDRDALQQRVEELEARIALQEREYLEAPIETD